LGQNLERDGLTNAKPNFNMVNMGLLYAKCSVDIFCHLSTMHEYDRETDRTQNSNIISYHIII